MKNYYVYVYVDQRKPKFIKNGYEFGGEPFYVGKGKDNRMLFHLNSTTKHTFVIKKIRKMLREGCCPNIIIFKNNLTEDESFFYEKFLINLIGRRNLGIGTLCNLTDGGEGISGKIWNDDERKKMSIVMKNSKKWNTFYASDIYQENMKKVSIIAKTLKNIPYEKRYGIDKSIEIKRRISENHANINGNNNPMYGKFHKTETKKKIAKKLRGNSNLGGRLGKTFSKFLFYKDGVLMGEKNGQLNAKKFCNDNRIPFQTLCKGKGCWNDWSCERNKKI